MATLASNSSTSLRDLNCLWHPFTQHGTDGEPIAIAKAKGALLFSEDGKTYIDAISSWWTNLHGHAHPKIIEQLHHQAQNLEHVMFADFTHLPAVELAEKLLKLLPGQMQRLFYSDNGSTAVETALKIALQYWHNLGIKKTQVLAFQEGYHGDTFGAMSAAGKNHFNKPFWPHLFEAASIIPPTPGYEELCLHQLELHLSKNEIAAFIYEPIIQGVAGMVRHCPKTLNEILKRCKKAGVLLIADEVMTGFGRLGPLFASELIEETPDLICLSKGLTGGFLPLGATACTEEIFKQFLSSERSKALLHGHSYTANPLGCAVALASLELLLEPECLKNRERIHLAHQKYCSQYGSRWKRAEATGTLLALQYRLNENETGYYSSVRSTLSRFFKEQGVVLRPLGDTVHVLPPYCIEEAELERIYAVLNASQEMINGISP